MYCAIRLLVSEIVHIEVFGLYIRYYARNHRDIEPCAFVEFLVELFANCSFFDQTNCMVIDGY